MLLYESFDVRFNSFQTESAIAEKSSGVDAATKAYEALNNSCIEAENRVAECNRRLQAVMVGKSEDQGVDKTYADQLKGASRRNRHRMSLTP